MTGGRLFTSGAPDNRSVFSCDAEAVIRRGVIHHDNFIARPQALQCPAEAQTVVVCVHDGSDGRHKQRYETIQAQNSQSIKKGTAYAVPSFNTVALLRVAGVARRCIHFVTVRIRSTSWNNRKRVLQREIQNGFGRQFDLLTLGRRLDAAA